MSEEKPKDQEGLIPTTEDSAGDMLSPTLLVSVSSEGLESQTESITVDTRALSGDGAVASSDLADGEEILCVDGGQKYKMGAVVAKGGMGIIREAIDLACRRAVAIKVLPTDKPLSPEEHDRFIEEAQITSQLEHPNIVPVHELGRDTHSHIYYSMKYVKGMTLTKVLMGIRKGDSDICEQFPLSRLLNIFQKVCDAIAFAHSRGVAHCDLKPDNIMICDFGEVLVMDWGLARRVGEAFAGFSTSSEPLSTSEPAPRTPDPVFTSDAVASIPTDQLATVTRTTTGRIMGTPGFMAPERIWGHAAVDVRSDVYSLGATLYSILALRAPISGKDMRLVLQRILNGDIRPPVSFNDLEASATAGESGRPIISTHCPEGKIPTALSDICMKALANDPADRYATVKELQQEVEAYQNGLIWHLVVDEPFDETFLDRWEVIGGQYTIKDGELRISGGEPQILLLKRNLPGDVRIEFECHQESVCLNDVSCFLSAIRSANRKEIPSSGYEFKYGAYDNSLNVLMRSDRRIWGESASPIVRGQTYRVKAERIGSRLRMVVNNEEIFRVNDRDPLSGPDRTAVGLVGWISDTRYRRIRVYCLGTPWKSDILDLADSQLQKGCYTIAMALYLEAMESFPDAGRLARARHSYEVARRRETMTNNIPVWKTRLEAAWPGKAFQLRMDNDGLTLDISKLDIDDLSPIADLPLTSLYCAHNRISSLEPLRGMPLGALSCTDNPIQSLEPLRGMPLTTLRCECCRIESLEPLRGMAMTLLVVGGNRIASLDPIRGMPLTLLAIWENCIEDLEPLRGMPLTALFCNSNRIASLEPLRGMPLVTLNCSGNDLASLEPLKGMPLTVIHCGENKIASLEPLRGMDLTMLSCQDNRIASLQPLKGMVLGSLTCGRNQLTSLAPFIEKPPENFLFDCDSLPVHELQDVRVRWSRDFRFSAHAKSIEVILALRQGQPEKLRAMTAAFNGHRYLFIPKFLRWEEARDFCEKMGGHLLTISSEAENEFVTSMFKNGCWAWMGLVTSDSGHSWITGQPVTYLNFVDALQERKKGPKVFSSRWVRDDVAQACNGFIIQWDS